MVSLPDVKLVTEAQASSSSDESPSSSTGSTAPSSIHCDSYNEKKSSLSSGSDIVKLPHPFFPPSIAQRDAKYGAQNLSPRQLSSHLDLPRLPDESVCSAIDDRDKATPDAWIPRDPRLVRLTGKHPFNAEAQLKDLYTAGFITPSNLFFVRNHGAVPFIDQGMAVNWELKIHGLCSNPRTFTLSDLRTQFRVITLPITLVCAGNRRKEQNIVRQSLGFSWGAGGVSTALFTGVYLADVLEYIRPTKKAKHVIFEGSDKLPNGPYGTSQPLSWARDKQRGMMLAWAMNGLALEPDHGFPLRLVVPSQIGGRSVKWLSRIELSDKESQHHLHFHDNKVLPMSIGPEKAREEKKWWYDPRYIIYDLNPNSAIAFPDHDEILDTTYSLSDTYTIKGYAYAGGGRRVTRVELSFDGGWSWELGTISYPEDLFRAVGGRNESAPPNTEKLMLDESFRFDPVYGVLDSATFDTSCFCWCFWSYAIPIRELKEKKSITVRCMDASMAVQPRDMYWNATGMMNNWWFRVAIHPLEDGKLRFEHPTMAGTQPGGWMQRFKDTGFDPSNPQFTTVWDTSKTVRKPPTVVADKKKNHMTNSSVTRKISIAELQSEGEGKAKAWFVVNGEVYEGHTLLLDHPGGAASIQLVAGEDATEDFLAIHSPTAQFQLAAFHIGTLETRGLSSHSPSFPLEHTQTMQINSAPILGLDLDERGGLGTGGFPFPFLHPRQWKKVVLVSMEDVAPNAKVFRFALPDSEQRFGLPVGNHIYIRLRRKACTGGGGRVGQRIQGGVEAEPCTEDDGDELVQRAYTPISDGRNTRGFVDFLIKIYYPTTNFPSGGRMSLELSKLGIGDTVEIKGPVGCFEWMGSCIAKIASLRGHGRGGGQLEPEERRISEIGFVCGGSGIAPVLQVLRAIFSDPNDLQAETGTEKTPRVWLLDVNRFPEDILFREELDQLAFQHRSTWHFRVHYSLTGRPVPDDWVYSTGRITEDMLKFHLPSPGKDKLVCICGPSPMEQSVRGALQGIGWDMSRQIVLF